MLEIVLVLAPMLMIALPLLIAPHTDYDAIFSGSAKNRWVTLIFLEACGVFCWLIVLLLRRLLGTVIKSSPFVYENVKCLKYISYLCAAAALVLIAKTFVDFSVMTPVIAILALLSSMFCQTLAMVFDKAVRIKDENDLTI
jgi:hypothetical protein